MATAVGVFRRTGLVVKLGLHAAGECGTLHGALLTAVVLTGDSQRARRARNRHATPK